MNGAFVLKAIVKDTQQEFGSKYEGLDLDGYYRHENRQQEHTITSVARICETEQRGVEGGAVRLEQRGVEGRAVRLRQSLNIAVLMEFLHLSRVVDVPHYLPSQVGEKMLCADGGNSNLHRQIFILRS
jgi:hypothetical protein